MVQPNSNFYGIMFQFNIQQQYEMPLQTHLMPFMRYFWYKTMQNKNLDNILDII